MKAYLLTKGVMFVDFCIFQSWYRTKPRAETSFPFLDFSWLLDHDCLNEVFKVSVSLSLMLHVFNLNYNIEASF